MCKLKRRDRCLNLHMEDKKEHKYSSISPGPRNNLWEILSERYECYRGPDDHCILM